jgi:hypothetical protein
VKLQEEKKVVEAQLQKEKKQLLVEQVVVKEAVTKACLSMPGLVQEEKELVETQVAKLTKTL